MSCAMLTGVRCLRDAMVACIVSHSSPHVDTCTYIFMLIAALVVKEA